MKARSPRRIGIITILVAGIASLVVGSPAFALSVDFTDGSWDAAHGLNSYTAHPSGIDLFASSGDVLTINYIGGPSGDNSGNDGVGLNNDEITQGGLQQLTITFPTPVTLNTLQITDLFLNEGPTGQPEVGQYSLDGGTTFTSFASSGGANGAQTLNIFQSGISSILFKSSNDSWSDFAVKGSSGAVPLPSTILLFVIGLAGLAWWRSRQGRVTSTS